MKVNIPVEKSLFGTKVKLEVIIEDSLSKVIDFYSRVNSGIKDEDIAAAENDLSEYYYSIIYSMDNYILPFWWEDFFSIETYLKSLVSQLMIFTNKIGFISNRAPFDQLLKQEISILEKIKKYFSDIILISLSGRREYINEITESVRSLQKNYLEQLVKIRQHPENTNALMIFDIFEKTHLTNGRIIDSINKINLGAAV